ncbi:hypothetical protein [Leptothoe spongobia]|uniref:Uncharacterized protein n=1 Tax=Leptothoe spongobia TAU-MAC 1115 TaxID=1967444 RepID=A0A947GKE4_9CYAN|nr:hypothetical protein [Leptothoe spongobia]MBT9317740.1 hypothetical protein [Leptothoe spongobia TAU-MAC 1115]
MFNLWRKAKGATIMGAFLGTAGAIIGLLTVPEDLNFYQSFRYTAQTAAAGSISGFAIDGAFGITQKVNNRKFNNASQHLKENLESGALDPISFLLGFISLNYYYQDSQAYSDSSSRLRGNSTTIGRELAWIVMNVFPRILPKISKENIVNPDFLKSTLFELYDDFLEANEGHDSFFQRFSRSRAQTENLVNKIIQKWHLRKAVLSSPQGQLQIKADNRIPLNLLPKERIEETNIQEERNET